MICQRPFSNFCSDLLLSYLIFSEQCFFKSVLSSFESLFLQTNWKAFFQFLLCTKLLSSRIKLITFVTGLITDWKIHRIGIVNTEISKQGNKINTLPSTGIQFLIWPSAVSLELFKIFSWLLLPCIIFYQIEWRQNYFNFHVFWLNFYQAQVHILLLLPMRFLATSVLFCVFGRSNVFMNKVHFVVQDNPYSLLLLNESVNVHIQPLLLNVCLV